MTMPPGRLFSLHVVARLLDFFDERTHWQRRLWNAGLVLSLREVIEAVEEQGRALHPAAVRALTQSVRRHVLEDPGAGSKQQRDVLARYLDTDLAADGLSHRAIRVALEDVKLHYLSRWEAALSSEDAPNRERTARAIASHLLDAGRTPAYLHEWLAQLVAARGEIDVVDLVREAQRLLAAAPTAHEVFIPFEVEPRLKARRPAQWIDSGRAADWLRRNGHDGQGIRQRGGFLLKFECHGPEEAVDRAADIADRFLARVALGERTYGRFAEIGYLADGRILSLVRGRRVEIRALRREEQLATLEPGGEVDAALELVAHLQSGSPTAAVAGGWSAIESLLLGPGDEDAGNVVAADRLAALVACSWPRAELTDLAWARLRAANDELGRELEDLKTNREKAARIGSVLAAKERLPELTRGSDIAATYRMTRLIKDPRRLLIDVRAHATESLRRLYRQRNLVLHGARTEAVALGATLRTSAPLVGAGFDRIVHGSLVNNLEPLQLAAKADFEIERLEPGSVDALVNLLE